MDKKTIASTIIGVAVGATGGLGAATFVEPKKELKEGQQRIILQQPNKEVIQKLSGGKKEITIAKRKFNKETGEEETPEIVVLNQSTIESDIAGKEDQIERMNSELNELKGLEKSDGKFIQEIEQFDTETGQKLAPITNFIEEEQFNTQVKGLEEAIMAVESQVNELENLLK